jgi:enoyl-CoA hydratase/carnithine racemase
VTLPSSHFSVETSEGVALLRLQSKDGTNRLARACVRALTEAVGKLAQDRVSLVITGNSRFFSAGADLGEIATLTARDAYQFSMMGQLMMDAIASFRAPVIAAITGYCMGGGLDLALACHYRIASQHAIFGHRGAALGLITGWGGTQRLPRLIGKGRALELLIATEKVHAHEALHLGLVDSIVDDPVNEALRKARNLTACNQ